MTCIVGLVDQGRLVIGGDSAGIGGWDLISRADAKVFRNGPFLMGFTSSYRMGQLLRYALAPPPHPKGATAHRFMSTDFVNAVRKCLKDGGFATHNNNVETGGTFLVGYKRKLFRIDEDFQVIESHDRHMSVGCGAQIAEGVLYALLRKASRVTPKNKVRLALQAAERFSAGVRGPFVIETLEKADA